MNKNFDDVEFMNEDMMQAEIRRLRAELEKREAQSLMQPVSTPHPPKPEPLKKMINAVYGSSDDLIEITGCISEEFADVDFYETGAYVGFSNGLLVKVYMDQEGIWRTRVLMQGDAQNIKVRKHGGFAPCDDEVLEFEGDVTWVVCSQHWMYMSVPKG